MKRCLPLRNNANTKFPSNYIQICFVKFGFLKLKAIKLINANFQDLKKAGCVRPTGRFLEARAASGKFVFINLIALSFKKPNFTKQI